VKSVSFAVFHTRPGIVEQSALAPPPLPLLEEPPEELPDELPEPEELPEELPDVLPELLPDELPEEPPDELVELPDELLEVLPEELPVELPEEVPEELPEEPPEELPEELPDELPEELPEELPDELPEELVELPEELVEEPDELVPVPDEPVPPELVLELRPPEVDPLDPLLPLPPSTSSAQLEEPSVAEHPDEPQSAIHTGTEMNSQEARMGVLPIQRTHRRSVRAREVACPRIYARASDVRTCCRAIVRRPYQPLRAQDEGPVCDGDAARGASLYRRVCAQKRPQKHSVATLFRLSFRVGRAQRRLLYPVQGAPCLPFFTRPEGCFGVARTSIGRRLRQRS
jgi:hypothetical protein